MKALTFFPPLVHMITLTQYRKSAIELLEIRQGIFFFKAITVAIYI